MQLSLRRRKWHSKNRVLWITALVTAWCISHGVVRAQTCDRYLNAVTGSDLNSGLTPSEAWQSFAWAYQYAPDSSTICTAAATTGESGSIELFDMGKSVTYLLQPYAESQQLDISADSFLLDIGEDQTITIAADASLTAGVVRWAGGTLDMQSGALEIVGLTAYTDSLAFVSLSTGARIGGDAGVTFESPFNWHGGVIDGSIALAVEGTASIIGDDPKSFEASQLILRSLTSWSGGTISLGDGSMLLNQGELTVEAFGSVDLLRGEAADVEPVFTNEGMLTAVAGGGVAISVSFVNSAGAEVDVAEGSLLLDFNSENEGTYTIGPVSSLFLGGGVHRNGATGMVRGTGTIAVSDPSNFTNEGRISPGIDGPGLLTFVGDFHQGSGALEIELGGTQEGETYDLLSVSGAVSLSGTLVVSLVDGFTPAEGDAFTFIRTSAEQGVTGSFDDVVLPDLDVEMVPRTYENRVILSTGALPEIVLDRPQFIPTSADPVGITATVSADPNRFIEEVSLHYFTLSTTDTTIETSPVETLDYVSLSGDQYFFEIPAFDPMTFVVYWAEATDDRGERAISDSLSYRVLFEDQQIVSLENIQRTYNNSVGRSPFDTYDLGFDSLEVTIVADYETTGFIAAQEGEGPLRFWRGIFLAEEPQLADLTLGDRIRIFSAGIEERANRTVLTRVAFDVVEGAGKRAVDPLPPRIVPFDSVAIFAERFEGGLIQVDTVFVDSKLFDPAAAIDEFRIASLAHVGTLSVDDESQGLPDDFNATLTVGQKFDRVAGIWAQDGDVFELRPRTIDDVTFAVVGEAVEAGPGYGLALAPNYPNPFADETVIPYRLERAAHVRLDLFDALGRRVGTLVDGRQPPGEHAAAFRAHGGLRLPAGLYLYRLSADGVTLTGTMLLIP